MPFQAHALPVRGVIAGIVLRLGYNQNAQDYTNVAGQTGTATKNSIDPSLGVSGGYMHQLPDSKVVVGIDAAALFDKAEQNGSLKVPGGQQDGTFNIKTKYSFTFGGFTGAMVNPKLCAYVRVGYGLSKLQMTYIQTTARTGSNLQNNTWLKGLMPGAGMFYFLDDEKTLINGEYNYFMPAKIVSRQPSAAAAGYSYTLKAHLVSLRVVRLF